MNKSLKNTFMGGSVVYLIIGLCLVVWPAASGRIICYALGALLLAFGGFKVIAYFADKRVGGDLRFDFILGAGAAILGLLFLIKPNTLLNIFGIVIGVAITLDSIVKLQFALELRRLGSAAWVRNLICALLMLSLGILLLFNPFTASTALTVFTGIALALDGIVNIWFVTDVGKRL